MNSALNGPAYPGHRLHWLGPVAFGAWAAAIAMAPDFTTKAGLAAPAVLAPLLWWTLYKPARWLALFGAGVRLAAESPGSPHNLPLARRHQRAHQSRHVVRGASFARNS